MAPGGRLMFTRGQLIPSSVFAKKFGSFLQKVKDHPVFITHRSGDIKAAFIDIDEYERLKSSEEELAELHLIAEASDRLLRFIKGKQRTYSFDDILSEEGLTRDELED